MLQIDGIRAEERYVYSLAKAVVQIAGSRSGLDAFRAREHSPARHILVGRRATQIKDDLELMGVALTSQNRFTPEHFAKHTSGNLNKYGPS